MSVGANETFGAFYGRWSTLSQRIEHLVALAAFILCGLQSLVHLYLAYRSYHYNHSVTPPGLSIPPIVEMRILALVTLILLGIPCFSAIFSALTRVVRCTTLALAMGCPLVILLFTPVGVSGVSAPMSQVNGTYGYLVGALASMFCMLELLVAKRLASRQVHRQISR